MNLSDDIKQRHAGISGVQVRFLEFLERHPEGYRRETFASALQLDELMWWRQLQPWPIFVGPALREELASTSVEVARLIRSIPRRVFDNDPERIAEHYAIAPEEAAIITSLIDATNLVEGALGRGDFFQTSSGLKCLEFNLSSNLGGSVAVLWRERFLGVPLIRRFLDENGIEVSLTDSIRLMFEHAVGGALDLAHPAEGELNFAFVMQRSSQAPTRLWTESYERELRAVLAPHDLTGSVLACDLGALTESGGKLWLGERRVHVLIETTLGAITPPIFTALMAGSVRVHNGPPSRILSDKLNLALLSELSDSDLFTAEERAVIADHIPWSRRVADEFVTWEGDRAYLPDLLAEQRERFVLKLGHSLGGEGVLLGRTTEPGAWQEAIRRAAEERTWIAQELVEPIPYLFQADESGCTPYDIVWGLFAWGEVYGGCYARMMVRGGHGVINNSRGAQPGMVFEVDEGRA